MWDLVIGKGDVVNSWSHIKTLYDGKTYSINMSYNYATYLIKGLLFGTCILVYKDTTIGQAIESVLKNPNIKAEAKIVRTLNKYILKKISLDKVVRYLKEEKENAHRYGVADAQLKIREALGME